jgi:hypothetical protein
MSKKTPEPKLILISLAQLDSTTGDGVSTFARAFTSKQEAAEWLEADYNEEADCHDWPTKKFSVKDIKDGKKVKSPEDDIDHDYLWEVIFQD